MSISKRTLNTQWIGYADEIVEKIVQRVLVESRGGFKTSYNSGNMSLLPKVAERVYEMLTKRYDEDILITMEEVGGYQYENNPIREYRFKVDWS